MKTRAVALIPARAGSKRIPGKNIRVLGNHTLLAYAIRSAIDSGVFDSVVCATDSTEYAELARGYGADVPELRPAEISGDLSPDIEWVRWMMGVFSRRDQSFDVFSILRPTSPFRTASTIRRAWTQFMENPGVDSLRAVQKCSEHPGKMWVIREGRMHPLLPFANGTTPWHSSPYGALPEIYVQNASLEIAWTKTLLKGTIAGEVVLPFLTEGAEGFDLNQPEDWALAERWVSEGSVQLPRLS